MILKAIRDRFRRPSRASPDVRQQLTATLAELGLSHAEFCETYGLSLDELRAWEAGRVAPPQAVLTYLRVIRSMPLRVAAVLHGVATDRPGQALAPRRVAADAPQQQARA